MRSARGTAPFQEHVDHRAFVFDYLATHAEGMRGWAERTRRAIAEWPDLSDDGRRDKALARIEARRARM